jgi:hypothetical protein
MFAETPFYFLRQSLPCAALSRSAATKVAPIMLDRVGKHVRPVSIT